MAPRDRIRIAAAGDVHCREANREAVAADFAAAAGEADLILIAGDLTSHGTVAEAEILRDAVAGLETPVLAVLGNHDWHAGEADGIAACLREGGVEVLEGAAAVCQIDGVEVGVVGTKGFVGGFAPHHLPDFGEPSLRGLYAETEAEVAALDAGLREAATCPVRVVLLHYAPIEATLEGEPREIFTFLGSDRLAAPLLEHGPDLVLHGHAHAGSPEGAVGEVPVYNVSQPLLGEAFRTFELEVRRSHSPVR
jgi:Icc-related predicted phosphoesterase